MEELIVRINNLLHLTQKTNATTKEAQTLGKFIFDASRYELTLEGGSRKLSHREVIFSRYCWITKMPAVTRKEILMKVGAMTHFSTRAIFDVYINKLRDYLKEDDAVKIITLKGVGYHFSVLIKFPKKFSMAL